MKKIFFLLLFYKSDQLTTNFNTQNLAFKDTTTIQNNYVQYENATIENFISKGLITLQGIIDTESLSIGNNQEPTTIFFYNITTEIPTMLLMIDPQTNQIYQAPSNQVRLYRNLTEEKIDYNIIETNSISSNTNQDMHISGKNNIEQGFSTLFDIENTKLIGNNIFLDRIDQSITCLNQTIITGDINCSGKIDSSKKIDTTFLNTTNQNEKTVFFVTDTFNYTKTISPYLVITTKKISYQGNPNTVTLPYLPSLENGYYIAKSDLNFFQTPSKKTLSLNITNNLNSNTIRADNCDFPNIKNVQNITINNLKATTDSIIVLGNWNNKTITIFGNNNTAYIIDNLAPYPYNKIIGDNIAINTIKNDYGRADINYYFNKNTITNIKNSIIMNNYFDCIPTLLPNFTHFIVYSETIIPGTQSNIAVLEKKTTAQYKQKISEKKRYISGKEKNEIINLIYIIIDIYKALEKKKKNIVLIKRKIKELKLFLENKNINK